MNKTLIVIFCLFLYSALTISWDCDGGGNLSSNVAPIARLSNIPPDGYLLDSPIDSLSWVGDDPDGFVTGFKYRWSYTITTNGVTDTLQKSWFTLLNVTYGRAPKALVLMIDTALQNSEEALPKIYKYFANLRLGDPDHPELDLPVEQQKGLYRGDTITVLGVRVYASNPDSTFNQATRHREAKRYPVHVNPNKGVFVFDSQDKLNFHDFQIKAIDNLGAVGPVASVTFYTNRQPPPKTKITLSPLATKRTFVLDHFTSTFEGIVFKYQAIDPNTRTREYQWIVDRDLWNDGKDHWSQWSELDSANITAADFPNPYDTIHTFYVRSKNEFGSIDTLGYFVDDNTGGIRIDTTKAQVKFRTLYPEFMRPNYQKRTLLINNSTKNSDDNDSVFATYTTVNNFYRDVMRDAGMDGKYDLVTTRIDGFPSFEMLSKYSSVIMMTDMINNTNLSWKEDGGPYVAPERQSVFDGTRFNMLVDYTRIGGKIIFGGRTYGLPINTSDPSFLEKLAHCKTLGQTIVGLAGAKGLTVTSSGTVYPSAFFNPNKMAPLWNGVIPATYIVKVVGFGERIYQDSVLANSDDYLFRNRDIGVRYQGITYSTVYLGFPLYYVNEPNAVEIMKTALKDIKELGE